MIKLILYFLVAMSLSLWMRWLRPDLSITDKKWWIAAVTIGLIGVVYKNL